MSVAETIKLLDPYTRFRLSASSQHGSVHRVFQSLLLALTDDYFAAAAAPSSAVVRVKVSGVSSGAVSIELLLGGSPFPPSVASSSPTPSIPRLPPSLSALLDSLLGVCATLEVHQLSSSYILNASPPPTPSAPFVSRRLSSSSLQLPPPFHTKVLLKHLFPCDPLRPVVFRSLEVSAGSSCSPSLLLSSLRSHSLATALLHPYVELRVVAVAADKYLPRSCESEEERLVFTCDAAATTNISTTGGNDDLGGSSSSSSSSAREEERGEVLFRRARQLLVDTSFTGLPVFESRSSSSVVVPSSFSPFLSLPPFSVVGFLTSSSPRFSYVFINGYPVLDPELLSDRRGDKPAAASGGIRKRRRVVKSSSVVPPPPPSSSSSSFSSFSSSAEAAAILATASVPELLRRWLHALQLAGGISPDSASCLLSFSLPPEVLDVDISAVGVSASFKANDKAMRHWLKTELLRQLRGAGALGAQPLSPPHPTTKSPGKVGIRPLLSLQGSSSDPLLASIRTTAAAAATSSSSTSFSSSSSSDHHRTDHDRKKRFFSKSDNPRDVLHVVLRRRRVESSAAAPPAPAGRAQRGDGVLGLEGGGGGGGGGDDPVAPRSAPLLLLRPPPPPTAAKALPPNPYASKGGGGAAAMPPPVNPYAALAAVVANPYVRHPVASSSSTSSAEAAKAGVSYDDNDYDYDGGGSDAAWRKRRMGPGGWAAPPAARTTKQRGGMDGSSRAVREPPPLRGRGAFNSLFSSSLSSSLSSAAATASSSLSSSSSAPTSLVSVTKVLLSTAIAIGQINGELVLLLMRDGRTGAGILAACDQHAADERCRLEALERLTLTDDHTAFRPERETDGVLDAKSGAVVLQYVEVTPAIELRLKQREVEAFTRFGSKLNNDWRIWCELVPVAPEDEDANDDNLGKALARRPPAFLLRVRRLPSVCGKPLTALDVRAVLADFVAALDSGLPHGRTGAIEPVRRILNNCACRHAIMFGQRLGDEEMQDLVDRLKKCRNPFVCAHGRPTIVPICRID